MLYHICTCCTTELISTSDCPSSSDFCTLLGKSYMYTVLPAAGCFSVKAGSTQFSHNMCRRLRHANSKMI